MSEEVNYSLKYVIDCLRRSADNSQCWPVYPAEAGAILAEFERLRCENEELRNERPAVVAYMRREADDAEPAAAAALLDVSDDIERGEHRREEER